ncbi:MAG: hypothetical protein VB021_02455 [Oscillospiraceae bacterium]|nr:hypothetical protein [Oscillospiraceae bacterium]
MQWLYKLQRKYGQHAISNLMLIILIGQLFVFFADLIFVDYSVASWFSLSRSLVLQGQVWRLITFVFIPPDSGVFTMLIMMYFYYMIGGALENEWGSFLFDIYYLIGVVCTVIAGMIVGHGTNMFLNLSLFFAFAILYPDFQVMLFFILPIKMKYLAVIDALFYLYYFIVGDWSIRAAIIAALVNVAIFFGGTFIKRLKQERGYRATRSNFRREMNRWH